MSLTPVTIVSMPRDGVSHLESESVRLVACRPFEDHLRPL